MKRKIGFYLFMTGGASILLTAFFCTLLFHNLFREQVYGDLKAAAQLLSAGGFYEEGLPGLSGKDGEIRVTLISPDGTVRTDTGADAAVMENHRERPEVAAALKLGQGRDARRSATLAQDTYYYAVRLEGGGVLRLAKNAYGAWRFSAGALWGALPAVALVCALCAVGSGALTRRVMAPVEEMVEQMDRAQPSPAYDELAPFARALKQKNEDIRAQMERLYLQQRQFNLVTKHMNEGLIILGRDLCVLSANESAARMLGAGGGVRNTDFTGKSFYYLSRDRQLADCVAAAARGESKSMETVIGGATIEIYASPVHESSGDEITGIMCFLLDVTERRRGEKMRREFTANVSHELKTPLTSICGYAELLAEGGVKDADIREFSGKIRRESLRLLDLITDIIKLSELDDVPPNSELTDCGLLALAEECAAALRHAAEKQGVSLSVEGEECVIRADAAMMEQMIHNLLDNAIRYNRQGGSVTATVEKRDGKASLCVRDTGIGIAKKHQGRIFERFYRVDKSRSKATGGTGLGLAIVKHAAEYHGARIRLESGENAGTAVTVLFPE